MPQFTLGTNQSVICKTCHTSPVATIDGRQVEECAPCYARSVRWLAMFFQDFTLMLAADRLDTAIELGKLISIEEELARR